MATTDRFVRLDGKDVGKTVDTGRRRARSNFACALGILSALLLYGAVATPARAAPGDLDTAFGTGGKVITDFGGFNAAEAAAVIVQPDGKIVAAGFAHVFATSERDFALARYNADGSLDFSFGSGGKVITDFGGFNAAEAAAVIVQPDGKIVAAGFAHVFATGERDFALARYLGDGALAVAIDIKPGSFPNSINLGSAGVVPVAILSSATFDATQVDPATVTLAGATVRLIGKASKYSCSAQDVNSDGLTDLVCHVETAQFAIQPGDSVAVLEAKTLGGQAIRGEDVIRIVP